MKYERQQHSQLFIAQQERKKKKMVKAATPYTLRGRVAVVIFIFSLVEREEAPQKVAQFGKSSRLVHIRGFFRAISAVK